MAQPQQVFGNGYEYSVIDNGAPGNLSGLVGGAGYDNIFPGAVAQGQNKFGNGTLPDCVNTATSYTMTAGVVIKLKNPA